MSIKGIFLAVVFIALVNGCQNKPTKSTEGQKVESAEKVEKADNYTSINDKYSFLVGVWTVDKENSSTIMSLTISEEKGKYAYVLETSKNVHKGFLEIKDGDEMYVTLPEIKWAEYRGAIPEDKNTEDVPSEEVLGIDFLYNSEKNELNFQNYGNAMNYYIKIAEIEDKYVFLKKR